MCRAFGRWGVECWIWPMWRLGEWMLCILVSQAKVGPVWWKGEMYIPPSPLPSFCLAFLSLTTRWLDLSLHIRVSTDVTRCFPFSFLYPCRHPSLHYFRLETLGLCGGLAASNRVRCGTQESGWCTLRPVRQEHGMCLDGRVMSTTDQGGRYCQVRPSDREGHHGAPLPYRSSWV